MTRNNIFAALEASVFPAVWWVSDPMLITQKKCPDSGGAVIWKWGCGLRGESGGNNRNEATQAI